MNQKFIISQTLEFARNEVADATKLLAQLIDDSILPSNGELDRMETTIKEIILGAKQFKEFLSKVREVDVLRKDTMNAVKENKEEIENEKEVKIKSNAG